MRSLGTLIILFLLFGIVNPFFSSIGYTQTSVEDDYYCDGLNMDIPGVAFDGEGYIFRGYFVNITIERSGTRIPSCPDQLQTTSNISWDFMNWPE